ncbi:MAG: hypothetical protein IID32_04765, partial [Planctomycetes bacterium]|nr:hypothetical protein [Planctomycetota bacterium]
CCSPNATENRFALMADVPVHDGAQVTDDSLDRSALIKVLAKSAIETPETITIGIYGDWGDGKSSFLHQLHWYLSGDCDQIPDKEKRAARKAKVLPFAKYKDRCTVVWFEAWRFQHDPRPIVTLLQEIRKQMSPGRKILKRFGRSSIVAVEAALASIDGITGLLGFKVDAKGIREIGGLAKRMPVMAFFLVLFTFSSIGLPGLNGFIGEFMVLLGTATSGSVSDGLIAGPLGYGYVIPAALGIILGAVYMLWMCQRVLFGPIREPVVERHEGEPELPKDLSKREWGLLCPLAVLVLVLGVYPKIYFASTDGAIDRLFQNQIRQGQHQIAVEQRPQFDFVDLGVNYPEGEDE